MNLLVCPECSTLYAADAQRCVNPACEGREDWSPRPLAELAPQEFSTSARAIDFAELLDELVTECKELDSTFPAAEFKSDPSRAAQGRLLAILMHGVIKLGMTPYDLVRASLEEVRLWKAR
jgi:hypothetical protein